MNYWHEFNRKHSFDDGDTAPDNVREIRAGYINAINRAAIASKLDIRAVAVDAGSYWPRHRILFMWAVDDPEYDYTDDEVDFDHTMQVMLEDHPLLEAFVEYVVKEYENES